LSDQPPSSKTEITGGQLLIAVIFMPVVVVWLILAARIIWSASSNPETLDNIEGLLTALAVLTIPVSAGLGKVFESFTKN
jgi:ABC-type transport system involved in cytochrome c biogenesis permease component